MTDEQDHFVSEVAGPASASDPAGAVHETTAAGLPEGYKYGVTRYADLILQSAFPDLWVDLVTVLDDFRIEVSELVDGGGGRTKFVKRFDNSLEARGWGKKNISIGKTIDGVEISHVRGHEIDMFVNGPSDQPYPGIACEMEWNNKDPFYDRDLLNYQALHHEGALAVGVIVTRGPALQEYLERCIVYGGKRETKYGRASTHWDKLIPRVNLGGGGECPLLLVGIEPGRLSGADGSMVTLAALREADAFKASWRDLGFSAWKGDAELAWRQMVDDAYAHMGL